MRYVRRGARPKRARAYKVSFKRRGSRKYSRPRRPASQRNLDHHVACRANHGHEHRKKFQSTLTFLKHYEPWMKG